VLVKIYNAASRLPSNVTTIICKLAKIVASEGVGTDIQQTLADSGQFFAYSSSEAPIRYFDMNICFFTQVALT